MTDASPTSDPASDEQSVPQLAVPELAPLAEFLAQSPPFHTLPVSTLYRSLGEIVEHYHRHGECLDRSTVASGLYIVRSGAVEIRGSDDTLFARLGEGEHFHIGELDASQGEVRATVIEDALVYVLPEPVYRELRRTHRQFDRYFSGQRSRRLRRAARYQAAPNVMLQPVSAVMSTRLLRVGPTDTVQQVAREMTAQRVSSALVVAGETLLGIITDRDLRVRVVAGALPLTTEAAKIMTPDPVSMPAADSIFAATLLMTRRGCHHLPVIRNGQLVGIVTTSDLNLAKQDDPVYLVQHISRAPDLAAVRELVSVTPMLMLRWVKAGMQAQQVSQILTAISDAVTVRLIQLTQEQLGPAPVPWCWTGFGSQARREQLPGADQDNGIIISNEVQEQQLPWFAELARSVCTALNSCGYSYCHGGIMATTDAWRQPLSVWQQTVRRWVSSPTPDAVMRVSIFFDLRCIHGDPGLCDQLQRDMLQLGSSNTIFVAALAANILDSRPPLGIFRRFLVERDGEHRDFLDLKKRGVLPLTEIVRLHALAHRISAVNTEERLVALVELGYMSLVDSRNLVDALHFIQQQRLQQQCTQIEHGAKITNYLKPQDLPRMASRQLRDAFTIIDQAQAAMRQTYRGGMG